jgi:PTS system nitrogen regulatory IIA component
MAMSGQLPQKEILTAAEVADYLRVSERTVYQWAQQGQIPAGKLGNNWRFKREHIIRWMDEQMDGALPEPATTSVSLSTVLSPDRILFLKSRFKEEVLDSLIDCLAQTPEIADMDNFRKAIFRREGLMSTGIGFGVGVPHVRLGSVKNVVMALGLCEEAVEDYETLDDEPIRIICMVAAGNDQHGEYLQLLSAISKRLKSPRQREALLNASEKKAAYKILTS